MLQTTDFKNPVTTQFGIFPKVFCANACDEILKGTSLIDSSVVF